MVSANRRLGEKSTRGLEGISSLFDRSVKVSCFATNSQQIFKAVELQLQFLAGAAPILDAQVGVEGVLARTLRRSTAALKKLLSDSVRKRRGLRGLREFLVTQQGTDSAPERRCGDCHEGRSQEVSPRIFLRSSAIVTPRFCSCEGLRTVVRNALAVCADTGTVQTVENRGCVARELEGAMRSGQWSDESVEGLAELKLTELEFRNLQFRASA